MQKGDITFPEDADRGTLNDGGGGAYSLSPTKGGYGGCPGLGGWAGQAGGHSIGLLLLQSQDVYLDGVQARGAMAGEGGAGGPGGLGGEGTTQFGGSHGGHGAGGDGGGGGAGGHSMGCMFVDTILSGSNFTPSSACQMGQGGKGGDGGAGGSAPVTDGRSGGDGAKGLSCGLYLDNQTSWSGTYDINEAK